MENKVNVGIYVIFDKVVGNYGLPFCAENDAVALRNFMARYLFLDDSLISDFSVIEVGQYDGETGKVEGYQPGSFREVYPGEVLLKEVLIKRDELNEIQTIAQQEIDDLMKLKAATIKETSIEKENNN